MSATNPMNRTSIIRRIAPAFLCVVWLSCLGTPVAAETAAKRPTAEEAQAKIKQLSPGATVSCALNARGNPTCVAEGVPTVVYGCDFDVSLGDVTASEGATLSSEIDPGKAKPIVKVGDGQLLCIIAQADSKASVYDHRFYVVAMPPSRVPACKGNDTCQSASIEWIAPKPAGECVFAKDNSFKGACAAGWVDSKDIEQFSMGL